MSFNNDNTNNFEGNFQSTGSNTLQDNYNSMTDRSAASGFGNDRSFQSNTGTGSLNSGFDRNNDPSTGSGFNNTDSFTNQQSGRSYDNTSSDRFGRDGIQSNTGTGSFNSGFDRTNDRSTGSGFNNTDSFTNEQSGRPYDNTSSGSFGREGMNNASSDNNRRDNNLRDNSEFSNRGYDNKGPNTEPREATRGSAGVMESSFGAENTTTSTFEKSQGESFGRGFEGSGQKPQKDMGLNRGQETNRRQNETGAAAGGSGHAAGQNQDFRNDAGRTSDNFASEDTHSSGHSSGHKQGLGQKLVNKAEGLLHHGHKSETNENRTGGGY